MNVSHWRFPGHLLVELNSLIFRLAVETPLTLADRLQATARWRLHPPTRNQSPLLEQIARQGPCPQYESTCQLEIALSPLQVGALEK